MGEEEEEEEEQEEVRSPRKIPIIRYMGLVNIDTYM